MLSERWIKKYMRQAKAFGEDDNRCYSRKIGVLIVNPNENRVLSMGLNGPPQHIPPCDDREYLSKVVWPQLTSEEKKRVPIPLLAKGPTNDEEHKEFFLRANENCGFCPRKVIGAKSGQRVELCSCEHAERNAVNRATESLRGAWAFCWCGVACWDCTKALIQAGISKCFFVEDNSYAVNGTDYSFGSRWLFSKAGVEIVLQKPDYYISS